MNKITIIYKTGELEEFENVEKSSFNQVTQSIELELKKTHEDLAENLFYTMKENINISREEVLKIIFTNVTTKDIMERTKDK